MYNLEVIEKSLVVLAIANTVGLLLMFIQVMINIRFTSQTEKYQFNQAERDEARKNALLEEVRFYRRYFKEIHEKVFSENVDKKDGE
jgi:hypothetical protein